MADLIASSKAKILSFANSLKKGASSLAQTLPPVQAYNAVKTMATPQFRQQAQSVADWGSNISQRGANLGQQIGQRIQQTPQFKMGPIQDFKQNLIKKAAPTALGMIGSTPGEFVRGLGQATNYLTRLPEIAKAPLYTKGNILGTPQAPTKAGVAFEFATALPDVTDLGKVALMGGLATSVLKPRLDAKALKPFLPEIRNVSKMLGNMDEIPDLTPQQVKAAEGIVAKIRGSNAVAQINKLNNNPKDFYNSLRTLLAGAEDQILNPKMNIGFTTKALDLPHGQTKKSIGSNMSPASVPSEATMPQIELPKTSIISPSSSQPIIPLKKNATSQEVAAQLPSKIDNFIQKALGYSTETPKGGTRTASGYTKLLRKGQEIVSTKVEQGLGSENAVVRNAASTLQNFFRGLGMSPSRANASMQLRGGISNANERAFNVMNSLYDVVGHNKASLEKINALLDPQLAKTKIKLSDLTPEEKQVYGMVREGLDLVHDTSYANGAISPELYSSNKGKYTPRMYDVMELPPEVNKFGTQGKKIVNDLYKKRNTLDDWKIEHSLNDPVYSLGKRLAQVDTNTAIKKYTDFLASNKQFISDTERAGFTKLSDSPAYGSLSGKYVLNSAAEDLKGFFFANQATQNLYDVFRAYDRLPIRQLQKKLLTVFNPTTNVGNIVSDQVFGFVTGVDPFTLNKNLIDFKQNPAKFKQLSDYLMKSGITGTDITRTDFLNKLGQIDELALGKKKSIFKVAGDKVQSFYGGTDDVYKASAFKALLDKGFTLEEATRKVADGFQNYANVGKFYDVAAKAPVVGSAFIKFQGDLIRIIKNGVVNNPLGVMTFLGTLYGVAKLSSKLSGESEEDYKTRTERFAAPMIPGLNIPLTWQTPWGEINAARYISPFFANNDVTNLGKMLPFVPNIDSKKDVASNIALNANDPLLSPLVNLAVNRDFRGKPISDPKENKYQPSTLTSGEKLTNQAKFAGRAYLPPPVNSAIDVNSAAKGEPNMYGAKQSVPQAVSRLAGIKISDMSSSEVQKIRDNDAKFAQSGNEFINQQVNAVYKQELKGEITKEQATKRIEALKEKMTDIPASTSNNGSQSTTEPYRYLDDKGTMRTIDLSFPTKEYKPTGNALLDKELLSDYKGSITSAKNDIMKAWEVGAIDQGQAIKELEKLSIKSLKVKKPKKLKVGKVSIPKSTFKVSKVKIKSLRSKNMKKLKSTKFISKL